MTIFEKRRRELGMPKKEIVKRSRHSMTTVEFVLKHFELASIGVIREIASILGLDFEIKKVKSVRSIRERQAWIKALQVAKKMQAVAKAEGVDIDLNTLKERLFGALMANPDNNLWS